VNWQHLKTFLWLRWRLIANRNRRSGKGAIILQAILAATLAAGGLLSFVGGIAFGYYILPKAPPPVFMYVWDGIVVAFLFMWMVELMIELQRSELLSLDKFLHLPVSLGGAFVINFVGSISSLGMVIFMPLMIGLSIGLVFSVGPVMLLLFPLIGAFALMVTALTHQFRGWLASLMVNQRRRRTVITIVTFSFVLLTQIPNIIGVASGGWGRRPGTAQSIAARREIEKLDIALAQQQISKEEYDARVRSLRRPPQNESRQQFYETARTINKVIPLGWLPYGAAEGFEGRPLAALLGMTGLAVIGVASLRRSYITTLRLYTGQFSGKAPRATSMPVATPVSTGSGASSKKYPAAFMEQVFPKVSEYVSVITVSSFRSLIRAPEAKMLLMSPIVMLFVFGGMTYNQSGNPPPELVRPLMVAGGYAFMLFMMVGLLGNLFGFDRSGFRVFVLSSAPRKDILMGKNLANAPMALAFMFITALALQIMRPMRVDHYIAILLQMIPMYLIFCLVGNFLSMIAPMPMAMGSLKPVKPKAIVILIQMAFVFVFPIAMAPTLIPLGIEFLLSWFKVWAWFPAYLLFTIVEVALVVWLYGEVLERQGRMLERRELRILEVVTTKVE